MSELNLNSGYFENPDIPYKDKIAMVGVLTHGNVNFFSKGNENIVMIIYFNPDKTTKGVISITVGANDSMAKNNCKLCAHVVGEGSELKEILNGIPDNNTSHSDKELIAKIVEKNLSRTSSDGANKEWETFIKPNLDKYADELKKEYPGIVTEELINTLKSYYLEALNSKKKQVTSDGVENSKNEN